MNNDEIILLLQKYETAYNKIALILLTNITLSKERRIILNKMSISLIQKLEKYIIL